MINRIRDIRREKQLTLADVAARCQPPTTAQTIGRLETGMRNLSLVWMNRIAAALEGEPELLVRGASRLALSFGISPLVVGLTIVAFGTSAPEMAVSSGAVLNGQTGLAMGNVVGSNIFNVLFILGLSALITPHGFAHCDYLEAQDVQRLGATIATFRFYACRRWSGSPQPQLQGSS